MLLTNLKRIIKAGFVSFWRNGFVSLASVLVMTIALFVIGSIVFLGAVFKQTLSELQSKADINVYFIQSAKEDEIMALKRNLERQPEVAEVTYVSREEAFKNFKDKHANDQLMTQVFDILGDNPLGASLTIRAKEVSQYENIAQYLSKSDTALSANGTSIIDDVNYYRNKVVIEKLSRLVASGQKLGFILTIFLVIISVIITFNTIRLAIYVSREEISVMQLVGASNKYIRGPFVVSGIMYGVLAAIITLGIFYLGAFSLAKATKNFFININLFDYYVVHFRDIFSIIFISGIALGGISSYMAVRRYLRV